tara:strand:- start:2889 stop:3596 length:708 start_codon:yes stop_codon:yes gene_type:complete
MALPKLEAVRYTTELPITKKKADFRPFLVKEQKVLLSALEGEDDKTIQTSMFDLIKACVYNEDEIKLDYLPLTDVEWLFVQIRIKSAGETADLLLGCDCQEEARTQVQVDLRNLIIHEGSQEKTIELTENIGINLSYPNIISLQNTSSDINSNDMFNMLAACVESIYDGDEVHTREDFDKKELMEFMESLSTEQFERIQAFFEDMPRLINKVSYECSECGKTQDRELQGISDFFG